MVMHLVCSFLPSYSQFMWLPLRGSEQPKNQGYVSFIVVSAEPNMAPVKDLKNTHTISGEARDIRKKSEKMWTAKNEVPRG